MAVEARSIRRPGEYGMSRRFLALNVSSGLAALVIALALAAILRGANDASTVQNATLVAIGSTARADALAQRVLADVLQLGIDRRAGRVSFATHADLNDAANALDALLSTLPSPALAADENAALDTLHRDWSPVRRDLSIVGDYPAQARALDDVVERTLRTSADLVAGLERIRSTLADRSAEAAVAAARGRIVAAIAIVIAAGIIALGVVARLRLAHAETKRFAGMLERMVAELAKSAMRLTDVRVNDEALKAAGSQGILSVDHRLRVTLPYSDDLCEVFGVPDLEGRPLAPLLQGIAPRRDHADIDRLVLELFDPNIADDRFADHPLRSVELGGARGDGTAAVRTLRFAFRRVREDGEIASVVIAVADVSERVALERELGESERRRVRQQAYLDFITGTDRRVVDAIARDVVEFSRVLGESLRTDGFARAVKGRTETVHAQVDALHDAAVLLGARARDAGFTYLADAMRRFDEETLASVRRSRIVGEEYLSLAIASAELARELEAFRALATRFAVALTR